MLLEALRKVTDRGNLTELEAGEVITEIMDGHATPVQIGALLAALRVKGETVDELVGFARVMRERSIKVHPKRAALLDMCGTGGGTTHTINVSTAAALIVAAAGIPIAKHGNRAVSSICGSADVLAALGVQVALPPEQIAESIDTVGFGFMFAPSHHPATKNASGPRREMGIRTVFNLLGPLTNPAGATRQLVGVFDPDMCPIVAEALGRLGCERAMVVHGMNGLDEISTVGPTRVSQLQNGRVMTNVLIPSELFIVPAEPNEILGGETVEECAQMLVAVLQGEAGAKRDLVCVNASAGLILGGMADSWRDGLSLAHRMIDTHRALDVLKNLVAFTRKAGGEPDAPATACVEAVAESPIPAAAAKAGKAVAEPEPA